MRVLRLNKPELHMPTHLPTPSTDLSTIALRILNNASASFSSCANVLGWQLTSFQWLAELSKNLVDIGTRGSMKFSAKCAWMGGRHG